MKKFQSLLSKVPSIKAIVVWGADKLPAEVNGDSRIMTWTQFLELGKDVPEAVIEDKVSKQKPGKCACLIYTSGTTGNPKGVMLSHDNLIWGSLALLKVIVGSMEVGPDDRIVSFLPLSHIAGMAFDMLF